MVLVMQDQVYNLCYRTGFVGSAIYIIYWNWLCQFDQVELAALGIVSVDEFPSCAAVYKSGD